MLRGPFKVQGLVLFVSIEPCTSSGLVIRLWFCHVKPHNLDFNGHTFPSWFNFSMTNGVSCVLPPSSLQVIIALTVNHAVVVPVNCQEESQLSLKLNCEANSVVLAFTMLGTRVHRSPD